MLPYDIMLFCFKVYSVFIKYNCWKQIRTKNRLHETKTKNKKHKNAAANKSTLHTVLLLLML